MTGTADIRLHAAAHTCAATRARRSWRWLRDALRLGVAVVLAPLSRRPVRPLADEAGRPLPGDDLLPDAKGQWTHAITIRERPEQVWPWLVQIGCRRGGWYSYDCLDNGGVPSAREILPEHQQLEVGDLCPWTPAAQDGFFVRQIVPLRALALGGDAGSLFTLTWAFALQPLDDRHTRLLVRCRALFASRAIELGIGLLVRPIHFAMQRRQLLTLKRRIERAAVGPTGQPLRREDHSDGASDAAVSR